MIRPLALRSKRIVPRLSVGATDPAGRLLYSSSHIGTARHNQLGRKHLDDLTELVASLATKDGQATIRTRPRGSQFDYLALDSEHSAWARRLWPANFCAGPNDSASDGHTSHQEPHRDRRSVPSACDESSKQRPLGSLGIEMKRLRVKLLRKRLDLFFVDQVRVAVESLPDEQVVEVESLCCASLIRVCHGAEPDWR